MIDQTPAARGGTPDEIADAVVYFLRASEFVTGQLMAVDGASACDSRVVPNGTIEVWRTSPSRICRFAASEVEEASGT